MKTSIQIPVIDQHINGADVSHFNALSSLICSTCLCVYTWGRSYQIATSCSSVYIQGLSVQQYLLEYATKGLMDTFTAAGAELWGQTLTFQPQGPSLKSMRVCVNVCTLAQPIISDYRCNLWVGVAQSRYINSEACCRAQPAAGASWLKCWMDSPCSLWVEVNSYPSAVLLGLLMKHLECSVETASIPAR